MKADIKERWIEKLESDEYDQTTGELFDGGNGFCCLGVLCEVAVEDGIVSRDDDLGGYVVNSTAGEWRENSLLPLVVKEWAGLDDTNPTVMHEDEDEEEVDEDGNPTLFSVELSELNDTYRLTFPQIATLIKDQL